MDIQEFLLARIAEDEALANAAIATDAPDRWENPTTTGNHWPENIAFWDRATPDRVLAECAAKRAIIKAHDLDDCRTDLYVSEPLLGILATVYSDHPDYQEEWAL